MTTILTILTIIGVIIAIICIGILASAILTVLAIKNWGRWDGNTYEADEIDLEAKNTMAKEELEMEEIKVGQVHKASIDNQLATVCIEKIIKEGKEKMYLVSYTRSIYFMQKFLYNQKCTKILSEDEIIR